MCGDEYCPGSEAMELEREWRELRRLASIKAADLSPADLARLQFRLTPDDSAPEQSESDEWRELDQRQRYRDAGGDPR